MAEKRIKCEFAQLAVGGLYDVHIPMPEMSQGTPFVRIHRSVLIGVVDEKDQRIANFESGVAVVDGTKGLWFERIHKV